MYRHLVAAVLAASALLWAAAPARASSVTGLTVDNSSPSQAAGAQTVYKIGFTTPGGVPVGGSVTLGFPSGTGFAGYNGSTVVDATTGASVGNCGGQNQGLVSCGLFSGLSIAAGHAVTVTVDGVANTTVAGATPTLSVTTTGDTTAATAPVTVVAAHPVSGVAVDNTAPTTAAGGQTVYVIGFTTSATGGISRAANSTITLTVPAGTTFGGYNGSSIAVGGTSVGNCGGANTQTLTIACTLFTGQAIAAGTAATITLNGITNPGAGSPVVTVSTTSDPSAVQSAPFSVVAANPVSGVSVDNTAPTTAAGGQTIYTIGFTVSATGGLSRVANSALTLGFPAGTTFGGYNGSSVVDSTAGGTSVGNCGGANTQTLAIVCTLFTGQSVPAGHKLAITLNGITNPGAGTPVATVSTTSDPSTVRSAPFSVVAANPVTGVTVDNTAPTRAAGGQSVYLIGFTTSATGGIARDANSVIAVAFPAGTAFTGYNGSAIVDTTAGGPAVGNCGGANTQTLTIACTLFTGQTIPAGHHVAMTFNGVANPAAGNPSVSVSTTSDPAVVASAPFTVVAANPLTAVSVDNTTPTTAAGGQTVYVIGFTTSATGGISRAANSTITLTFPAGTTFGGYNGSSIAVGGTSVGNCGGANTQTLTIACTLFTGQAIAAGTAATITLNGITNPGAGTPSVKVATTSDPAIVNSAPFSVGAAHPLTGLSVGVGSTAPGATSGYTVGFTASATGALSRLANSAITLGFPAGTTFTSYNGSNVVDTGAGSTAIGNCGGANTQARTIACTLFTGKSIPAGHVIVVTLAGITNPPGAGPYTLTASTTSDPAAVTSSSYSITQGPPPATVTGGPSGVTSDASPAFSFVSTDPSATFQCRLDGPAGAGTFAACVSPWPYIGLAPGQYTFLVRSVDAAGNPSGTPASRSFTVAAPQPATPTPTPTPTATPTPTPVAGKTVVAAPVKGTVKVRLPGTNTFVDLNATQGVPVGATVDTRHGTVQLTALQKPGGKPETAIFFDGLFKLTQTKATTDLTLNEPLAPCGKGAHAAAAAKKPKTRKLWGSGHGSFRTRGTYSAATVRGTKWLVQDSCAGTLTRVTQGVVSVRDNVRRKTIILRAGKKYLARPKR